MAPRLRPDDAGIVMRGLDDGADEPRHADAIGAHLHRDESAAGPCTLQSIASEYLVPKKKMCPTSMPRAVTRSFSGTSRAKRAASCFSEVAAYLPVKASTTADKSPS